MFSCVESSTRPGLYPGAWEELKMSEEKLNRMYEENHCHISGKVYFCSECTDSTHEKCLRGE